MSYRQLCNRGGHPCAQALYDQQHKIALLTSVGVSLGSAVADSTSETEVLTG